MSFLLIISTFNFNKKKPLFDFKIVIFEFILYKFSTLRHRRKRTFFLISLIFYILFLRFRMLIIIILITYFIVKASLIYNK